MKKFIFTAIILLTALITFAQEKLLSYEDISYLLHNNVTRADTFMISKGYTAEVTKPKDKIKKYMLKYTGNTLNEVSLRLDGKKLYISIETNVLEQYNLLLNSISQYKTTASNLAPDVSQYEIKDLGIIYITISDSVPYDALKKDYDIRIVPDKNIVAID